MAWSKTELAWTAGFVEGEGNINISMGHHKNRTSPNPLSRLALEVCNTDVRGLSRLQLLFGGNVVERKFRERRARLFRWVITSERAIKCLKAIKPYTCFKTKQIELAIAFQKTIRKPGGSALLGAEIILYRSSLVKQLRALTCRGGGE